MNGPTVYKTLMQEAYSDAVLQEHRFWSDNDAESALSQMVAPNAQDAVRKILAAVGHSAYVSGVIHGYTQAAIEFDKRNPT